jgi:NADPH-dependent ferric siderophore reductase
MPSIRARIQDTFAQLVFKEFAIDEALDVSAHFRRFRVSGESLRATGCSAGDKIQIMISEAGTRTFSPFSHDPAAGTFEFLAFVHGDAPAAAWCRNAQVGQHFRAFGPRGSLPFSSLMGPVVMFGDETSFGAARSLLDARGGSDSTSFVFESTEPDEAQEVLNELGLGAASVVPRRADRAHVSEVAARLRAAVSDADDATLVLTGHAQMIQAIRAQLKAEPLALRGQKVKAYWADGKKGLD